MPSRENDGTGLYYYRARYYSPALQRFISEDPIGFRGGINKYAYVGNSPINNRDPLGLFCLNVSGYDGIGGGAGFCITGEGASVCGEIGFGIGVSVGADIGGGLEKTGTEIVAEASYGEGGAEGGFAFSIDNNGCGKAIAKGQIGPVTFESGNKGVDVGKVGVDFDVEHAPKIGAGGEAKLAAKGCIQGKF